MKVNKDRIGDVNGSILYAPACDDIYDFLGSYTGTTGKR
jgi:hypothetical protein